MIEIFVLIMFNVNGVVNVFGVDVEVIFLIIILWFLMNGILVYDLMDKWGV